MLTCDIHRSLICLLPWSTIYHCEQCSLLGATTQSARLAGTDVISRSERGRRRRSSGKTLHLSQPRARGRQLRSWHRASPAPTARLLGAPPRWCLPRGCRPRAPRPGPQAAAQRHRCRGPSCGGAAGGPGGSPGPPAGWTGWPGGDQCRRPSVTAACGPAGAERRECSRPCTPRTPAAARGWRPCPCTGRRSWPPGAACMYERRPYRLWLRR